jgi:hypothetical protein
MLIGPVEASRYLGVSLQLVQYRAAVGKLRVARRKPTLKFRLADILDHARTSTVRPYRRHRPLPPTAVEILDQRLRALTQEN